MDRLGVQHARELPARRGLERLQQRLAGGAGKRGGVIRLGRVASEAEVVLRSMRNGALRAREVPTINFHKAHQTTKSINTTSGITQVPMPSPNCNPQAAAKACGLLVSPDMNAEKSAVATLKSPVWGIPEYRSPL